MKCPYCRHEESKVTDSRASGDLDAIKRRRECLACGKRFTTFETIELALQVKKRDGTYQDFSIEKLSNGILACCRHTKVGREQVRVLSNEISSEIRDLGCREIQSIKIGEIVMERLKILDTVAYIRFACVYKRFKDMDALLDAIQTISV